MLRFIRKPLRPDRHETTVAIPDGSRLLDIVWDGRDAVLVFLGNPDNPLMARKFLRPPLESELPDVADRYPVAGTYTPSVGAIGVVLEVPGPHIIPDDVRYAGRTINKPQAGMYEVPNSGNRHEWV